MPAFTVEVPTGSISLVAEVPTIWPGYNVNTVLYVHPNGGVFSTSDDEMEIFFSDVNTENLIPYLEGEPMVVNSTTHNSIRVALPTGELGGPFRGTFSYATTKPVWLNTEAAEIASEYSPMVTVAFVRDKEIVSDTLVSYEGSAVYVDDYAHIDGTANGRVGFSVPIHGIAVDDSTPHFLILAEVRIPDISGTVALGDSDRSSSYYGWLVRFTAGSVSVLLGDAGTASSANRRSFDTSWASFPNFDYAENEGNWFKIAIYTSSLTVNKISINGGPLATPTSISGTGSDMDMGSTSGGQLGSYTSDVDALVESAIDIRNLVIMEATLTDQNVIDLCVAQYDVYQQV